MISSKDYAFGLNGERSVIGKMSAHFKTNFSKTEDVYDPFDFKDSKTCIELKTRRNTKNAYPTTMVGANKVKIAQQDTSGKKYIFAFNFTDGLYYIEYEKELFSTFETSLGGRSDRGQPEMSDYCFIPVSLLKPLV
jgi:hypothetical protein